MVCPHAGFVYSGPVACHSFYSISSSTSKLAIITGPNHYGIGQNVASMVDSSWKTPLGLVEVDSESALELREDLGILELDSFSHSKEHSIEVQIPMLQETFPNEMKILPVSLIAQEQKTATKVGSAIAKLAQKKDALLIGSSDFTHYEENGFAHKQDMALIEPILKLDVDEFYKVLHERNVTSNYNGETKKHIVYDSDERLKETIREQTGDNINQAGHVNSYKNVINPDSYTNLTLPTNRIV